jgi:DNA polymerase III delta prime subunit
MTTDMPEVIYATNPQTQHDCALPYWWKVQTGNAIQYVRTDKHEELKAIAEILAEALEAMIYLKEGGDFQLETPIYKAAKNAITEYNKFKGVG